MSDPQTDSGRDLATTTGDVYADTPFAGTVFESSDDGRSWITTADPTDPVRLSTIMEEHDPTGELEIHTHDGTEITVEVGGDSSSSQTSYARKGKRQGWIEQGKHEEREKWESRVADLKSRHRKEIDVKEDRIRQKEEEADALRERLSEVRRTKEEEIERERQKRRDREEELEEKYKGRIQELEEKVRTLKGQLLEAESGEESGFFGDLMDVIKEDPQIRSTIAQLAAGGQQGPAQQTRQEPRQTRQNAARQMASRQMASRQMGARGDGAPTVAASGGSPPNTNQPNRTQPRGDQSGDAQGESRRESQDAPEPEDGENETDQETGGEESRPRDPEKVQEVAQVAASCLEHIALGQADVFSDQLRGMESVQEWGATEWLSGIHALCILGLRNEIPAEQIADFLVGEIPHWATDDVMEQVRAAQSAPTGQVVMILEGHLQDKTGATLDEQVKAYVRQIVGRLQTHDL